MSLNTHSVVLLAFAMVLSGCATEPDAKPETGGVSGLASDPLVIEARAGDETRMRRGQLLAIALDSNASTGYAWEIVEDGSPLLEPASVPASTAPAAPPMPGAGGTSRWRYRAVQTGTTTLRLVYRRSWEQGVEPMRTASYRVVVE